MSLEAALDDERREVMNILEGRPTQSRGQGKRSDSPYGQNVKNRSSAPPVRSMLDIANPISSKNMTTAAQASGAGYLGVRSMLDTEKQGSARNTQTAPTSPEVSKSSGSGLHRARSDASESRPRALNDREGINLKADYQFSMLPTIQNQALPKRVTLGGKKQNKSSMAAIMQGQELGSSVRGRDRGRHNSTAGVGGGSKSPSSRLFNRSQSPGVNLMSVPGKFVTETGKVIDMNNAYRKLSDAALLNSGGGLANLPTSTASNHVHLSKGESLSPTGEIRLQKDYYPNEGGEEDAVETSEEDPQTGSSGDEIWGQQGARGRKRGRRNKGARDGGSDAEGSENDEIETEGSIGLGKAKGPRKVKSLLAAAEEERLKISARYSVKSLLEPAVTVTGPGGERLLPKKSGVHPNTNYDQIASVRASPATSDSEELSEIRHAQRLNINSSPIDSSIPHRVIRTIIRGDFPMMQREAEEGSRRLRTYLVATDLSDEAAYALEWTIGTVLRDGDTLLAVYAVDEDIGTGKALESDSILGLPVGEGAKAMQDTAAMVEKMTLAAQNNPSTPGRSPLSVPSLLTGSQKNSSATSTDSRYLSKAEQERLHAIEGISQTCIRFLRKTKLQVRIAVEVIHCKSPKYMITEAIDGLEPTLVILGSRGRSALKGVLLGSFSNYLVTKSSVPVMVARKRLSGRKSKNVHPNVRLANNLTPTKPLPLDQAKID